MKFEEIKEKLSGKTVGICGAGGLGSNCAAALIRVGVGRLIIADFDVVSEQNLNRQFYFYEQIGRKKVEALRENLLRIQPSASIVAIDEKLSSESIALNFGECDVIVEAFDLAEMKQMLIEAVHIYFPHIPLVSGMGLAGFGKLNDIKVHVFNNLFICGDLSSEVSAENPPIAPKVGVVSNMEADVVVSLLLQTEIN